MFNVQPYYTELIMMSIFVLYNGYKPVEFTTAIRGAKEKAETNNADSIVELEICGSILNPILSPKHLWKKVEWGSKCWMEHDLSLIIK